MQGLKDMVRETTTLASKASDRQSRLSNISNQFKFKLETTLGPQMKTTRNLRKKLSHHNSFLGIAAATTTKAIKSIDNAKFDAKKDPFLIKLCLMNARLQLFNRKKPSVKKSTKVLG